MGPPQVTSTKDGAPSIVCQGKAGPSTLFMVIIALFGWIRTIRYDVPTIKLKYNIQVKKEKGKRQSGGMKDYMARKGGMEGDIVALEDAMWTSMPPHQVHVIPRQQDKVIFFLKVWTQNLILVITRA
jgi:hypothetical protein